MKLISSIPKPTSRQLLTAALFSAAVLLSIHLHQPDHDCVIGVVWLTAVGCGIFFDILSRVIK